MRGGLLVLVDLVEPVDSRNMTGYLITSEVCPPIPRESRGSKLFNHRIRQSTLARFCLRYSVLLLMAIGLYIRGAFAANARGCEHCLRGARASHSSGRIEGRHAGGFRGSPRRAHDSLKNRRCAASACVCRALRAGGYICTPSAFAAVCRKLWARGNGRGCAAISEECRKIEGRLGIAGTVARVSSFGHCLPPVVALSAAP